MAVPVIGDRASDPQLLEEDLPLGPWASATLQVWGTKTGTRWHADPNCSSLKSQARTRELVQPADGTLGDRNLPDGLHCDPLGLLRDYLTAARRLASFAAKTDKAEREWAAGNVPVSAFQTHLRWGRGEVEDRLQEEPLASLWQAELARRGRLIARIDRFLGSNDERLAAMVLADWVRRGRTPREHKRYYDRFVAMAVRHFDDAEITTNMGMHYSVNRDSLPNWLDAVSSGKTFESATTTLAEKEHALARRMSREDEKDLPDQVQGAWLAAGASWQLMLESMALAHPGSVLALFQRYGSEIDPDLIELVARLGPSASLEIAHIDWTVAVVPAACRVAFASSGRTGRLILLDNPGYRVTDETCELFLRNVVRAAGYPELAQHVRGRMPEQSEQSREVTDSEYDMARALSQRGFNTRGYGFGLTIGDCDTALRAAMQGEEFARPTVSRSRRSRR